MQPPSKDDLCTVCYTSGTTGNPKGVMLSHENVVASMSAVMMQMGDQRPNSTDVLISYLPLAHMLERCCQVRLTGGALSPGRSSPAFGSAIMACRTS